MAPEKRHDVSIGISLITKKAEEDLKKFAEKVNLLRFPFRVPRIPRPRPERFPKNRPRTIDSPKDDSFGLEIIRKSLKDAEAVARQSQKNLDRLRSSPDFIGKEKQIQAARKAFDDSELRQWDIATTIQGIQDSAPKPETFFDIWEEEMPIIASSGFGPSIEQLTEPLKKLKKQAGPVEEQFNNVALAYGDQIDQVRSLVPAMKQAGAGLKGMEGMLTSFASMSGPALENFLGGLMRGKGGLTESLLAA